MDKKYLNKRGLSRLIELMKFGKRQIWHGTQEEWDALTAEEKDKYDQAEIIDANGITAVDKIEEGNMNPVTSNAVAEADKFLEDVEIDTGRTWIHGEKIYRLVHKVILSDTDVLQTFSLSSVIDGNKITRVIESKLSLNHIYVDGHSLVWYGSNYTDGTNIDSPEIRVRCDVGGANPYIQIRRPKAGWWGGSTEKLRTHYAIIEYCKDESAFN